jgi:hypothetical protein
MWPAWLAITTPDPPKAITRLNSSRTWATPTKSTAMMAAGDAWAGDSPAVWTTCIRPRIWSRGDHCPSAVGRLKLPSQVRWTWKSPTGTEATLPSYYSRRPADVARHNGTFDAYQWG